MLSAGGDGRTRTAPETGLWRRAAAAASPWRLLVALPGPLRKIITTVHEVANGMDARGLRQQPARSATVTRRAGRDRGRVDRPRPGFVCVFVRGRHVVGREGHGLWV